jgi:hypothetical protein
MNTLFGEINTVEDLQKHWRDPYLQWWAAGMPSHNQQDKSPLKQIMIKFKTKEDREYFAELMDYKLTDKTDVVWYPNKLRSKNSSSRYVQDDMEQDLFEDDDQDD